MADSSAILPLVEKMVAAWNRKDPSEFGSFFRDDARFNDVTGHTMAGRSNIEQGHVKPWTTVLAQAELRTDSVQVHPLAPDVVSVELRWTTTGHTTPDGHPLPPRNGLLVLVLVGADDSWSIALATNADYTATYRHEDADGPPRGRPR